VDRRTAIASVARHRGVSRRDIYDAVVQAKSGNQQFGK
jgi:DNA-binding phage protein